VVLVKLLQVLLVLQARLALHKIFDVHHPPWCSLEVLSPQPLDGFPPLLFWMNSIVNRQIKVQWITLASLPLLRNNKKGNFWHLSRFTGIKWLTGTFFQQPCQAWILLSLLLVPLVSSTAWMWSDLKKIKQVRNRCSSTNNGNNNTYIIICYNHHHLLTTLCCHPNAFNSYLW